MICIYTEFLYDIVMETNKHTDILIVVDMQNDFVSGSLGSKEAKEIVKPICEFLDDYEGEVFFTRDTHESDYLSTEEGKHLPIVHCINGTKGHEIVSELLPYVNEENVIDKPTFGSITLAKMIEKLAETVVIDSITLIGVCTDICVISNALLLKAYFPNTPIKVVEHLCAGSSEKAHEASIAVLKSCQVMVE